MAELLKKEALVFYPRAVLFDLDRTLINSGPAHDRTINPRIAREFGFKEPIRFKGRTIYRTLHSLGFSLERIKAYTDRIEELEFQCRIRPFPKVNELLRALKNNDVVTAIVTNRPTTKRYFEVLRHFGLKTQFIDLFLNCDFYPPEIETPSKHFSTHFPKPDKRYIYPILPYLPSWSDYSGSVLMVGDHLVDWEMARKNKFDFIPVLSGVFPEPEDWIRAGCYGPFLRDISILYKWWFC